MSRAGPRDETTEPWSVRDTALAVLLAAAATAVFFLLRATAPASTRGDPFDSPLFYPVCLLTIAASYVVAYARPGAVQAAVWVGALTYPFTVGVWLIGYVLYDGSGGASFWAVGLLLFWFPVITTSAVSAGLRAAVRTRRPPAP
jgi:hypothetical protein